MGGVVAGGLFAGCLGQGGSNTDSAGSVEEWLSDTDDYNTAEQTGKQSVTVDVGTEGNNGTNAFAPAVVKLSPGTTVTWNWVEGYHNVVATEETFDSGEPEKNGTFEHTFETPGTFLYYCAPHKSMGMKGAVIVQKSTTTNGSETQ